MHTLSRVAVALSTAVLFAGCAKKDAVVDSTAVAPAPPAPAPFSFADAAGKWQLTSVPQSGTDTTTTKYVLTATGDTTGWVITFANGTKVPVHVTASGDSALIRTDTYTSVRRKGMKVMTEGSYRIIGGSMTGTNTAHYQTKGADSVLQLRTTGTKIP